MMDRAFIGDKYICVLGLLSVAYLKVKKRVANQVPKDLTWFGPIWQNFLKDYDTRWNTLQDEFKEKGIEYESRDIDSSATMGPNAQTHVHICGNRKNPVILLLPGIRLSSTMWIPHIMDLLSKNFCVVCLDYPFDLGRSIPAHETKPEMNRHLKVVNKFVQPKSRDMQFTLEWLSEVLDEIEIDQLDAAAGYSLGAYLLTSLAIKHPEKIKEKAHIFIAAPPHAFTPPVLKKLYKLFLIIPFSILTGLPLPSLAAEFIFKRDYETEVKYGIAHEIDFDTIYNHMALKDEIINYIGSIPLSLPFDIRIFKDNELKGVAERFHPTYLCLEHDIFYRSVRASHRAKELGFRTIFAERAAHMFYVTQPNRFHQILLDAVVNL